MSGFPNTDNAIHITEEHLTYAIRNLNQVKAEEGVFDLNSQNLKEMYWKGYKGALEFLLLSLRKE